MLVIDKKFDFANFHEAAASGFAMLVNKPVDWTSFDVVAKLRNLFKIKKVGHAGTLDPFATGLLILCFNKATKQIDDFQAQVKTYHTVVEFGRETDSYDVTGQVVQEYEYLPTETEITENLNSFIGTIEQVPPMFSALKINGKKLYELAREGKEVERKARQITIYSVADLKVKANLAEFSVVCSKGTYIRSLAYDLGKKCNSGAYLKELTRTAIGDYQLADALDMEEIIRKYQDLQIAK